MKLINAVSIWDNGQVKEAKILNAYAVNVTLGTSATFYYQLFSENVDLSLGIQLAQGNLSMTGEAYAQWEVDAYAWDWVASELNLTIIGDYVPPVPPAPEPEPETTTEETTETEPTPEPETEG
jgi:hypothetical protein